MKTTDAIRRAGVSIAADATMADAAALMADAGVGALAVMDGTGLVGIVTDRDIVCRGIARGAANDVRIDSLMTTPAVTIDADTDLHDAFKLFRQHGLRRLPVMQGSEFRGVITVDDLLVDLAADLSDLARPVTGEVLFGHHESGVPSR